PPSRCQNRRTGKKKFNNFHPENVSAVCPGAPGTGSKPPPSRLNYRSCRISSKIEFQAGGQFTRVIVALLLTGILGLASNQALAIDRKVALVIGNAKYPDSDVPLNDAVNDARDIADELTRDGFDVEKGIDLGGDAMRQALERFYAKIAPGSAALIFF